MYPLTCADNLFAFRPNQTCAAGEAALPTSGLYIDDLAGISLAAMSQLGKHTYRTAQDALNSKTQVAVTDLFSDIQVELMRHGYIVPQEQAPKVVGCYTDDLDNVSVLGRGMVIKRTGSCSRFSVLYLDSIKYKGDTTESMNFEVYSYENDAPAVLLDTVTATVTANYVTTISIDKYYAHSIVILAYPTGAPYKTKDVCDCLCNIDKLGNKCNRLLTHGYDGVAPTDSSTFGITVCATVRCSMELAICSLLPLLRTSLWYKVAALLLGEMLAYTAPTQYTTGYVATDPLKELKKEYEQQAQNMRTTAISAAVQNLRVNDTYCIGCSPNMVRIKSLR